MAPTYRVSSSFQFAQYGERYGNGQERYRNGSYAISWVDFDQLWLHYMANNDQSQTILHVLLNI